MFCASLLTSAKVQEFIRDATKRKLDALQISTALSKAGYSNEDRAAIMDYMALVPKIKDKFGTGELLCDKLALEQSTAQDIGRWKANLWPAGSEGDAGNATVHDLCCGMGGDSFFIPANFKIVGIDLDENRLAMYSHNIAAFKKNAEAICADVREVASKNDSAESPATFFTIDPARRAQEGENQWDLRNLTPSLEEVIQISKHYQGGMVKLPPGYPPAEFPDGTEILYLGGHSDCRECLVLFGTLARHPDTVRAVMVDKSGNALAQWCRPRNRSQETLDDEFQEKLDRNDSLEGKDRTYRTATSRNDLPIGDIAKYISEPAPILIRSHLFSSAAQAQDPEAHLISEGIAYVASNEPLPAPGFTCYQVIAHSEISTSAVRSMLKEHDIGKLTLKLRGVHLDPDAEIKRLKPKGKNSAILFYTRKAGEKIALLGFLY
jgi:hypothetical protein